MVEQSAPGPWNSSPGCGAPPSPRPAAGKHEYKLLLDDKVWLADPANPARAHDGYGAWNSGLIS